MSLGSKIYLWMTRFNTVALTIILVILAFLFIHDRYQIWFYSDHGRLNDGTASDSFGAAARPAMPISGQEMRVPGGTLVSYYFAEDSQNYEWDKGQNITIVDLRDGSSHKLLEDNDPRAIINWELIEKNGENPSMYLGYVAWASTKEQYDQGRADLLISAFPDVKQHTIARNVKYAYLPKVSGNSSIAIIMWPEEDEANYVSFDLKSGEIIEKKKIELPKLEVNFLSLNNGLPEEKFARLDNRTNSAPINSFGF
ncbi:hypothetical protein [Parasphingorhabdus sp.]|uniref:hypothetical protein n=1 Tax=Parasphingorhabdus sp. TaxID=2709688 RepID=UPI0035942433